MKFNTNLTPPVGFSKQSELQFILCFPTDPDETIERRQDFGQPELRDDNLQRKFANHAYQDVTLHL